MFTWSSDEIDRIGQAEELQIASMRGDGTLRKPVIIWVVRLEDDLYVRCVNGRDGAWFRGALTRHEGRIWAGGVQKDVAFVEQDDPAINERIDTEYMRKYGRYPQYVAPMVTPKVRAATLRLAPLGAGLQRSVVIISGLREESLRR